MKIKMIHRVIPKLVEGSLLLIFIGFFLIFGISPIFAEVNISIDSYPSSVTIGQEFTVSITANDLSSGTSYYLKGRIGSGTDLDKAETNNPNNSSPDDWLFDTDSWSKFPQITIGDTSTWSGTLKLRAKSNASAGQNILRIRLKKTSSDTKYDSEDYTLNLEAVPTPTPSITPSANPTNTPTPKPNTPTNTPIPSATPTPNRILSPTPTPKVTKTVTPAKTAIPTVPLTPASTEKTEAVLGEQDNTSTPSAGNQNKWGWLIVSILISLGFICIGIAVFLSFKTVARKRKFLELERDRFS